jgi:dTDP-4-dehydrorhamnose reductase
MNFNPDPGGVDASEFEVLGLTRRDLDVTNRDAVLGVLRNTNPDVVVHLAAYTAVDRAEEDAPACFLANEWATSSMSFGAREVGAHLITISTDYVFDGLKGDSYLEDDEPHPLSVYGASKLGAERSCTSDDTIVRTSWVMGVRGKNVVHLMAERAATGGVVRFVNDQMGTVSAASDLARALVVLIRERPGGTWHIANNGATTWFDIAHYVGQLYGRGDDFATPITTSELSPPPLATRPPRSDLNCDKFSLQWSSLAPWRDAVARVVAGRAGLIS